METIWDDGDDRGSPEGGAAWEPSPDDLREMQADNPDADADWEPSSDDLREMQVEHIESMPGRFGRKVRELRKLRGWTQADLAIQLNGQGISAHQTTVAKIENGARPTSVPELWALASLLHAHYDELLPPVVTPLDPVAEAVHQLARQRDARMRAEAALLQAAEDEDRAEQRLQDLQRGAQTDSQLDETKGRTNGEPE